MILPVATIVFLSKYYIYIKVNKPFMISRKGIQYFDYAEVLRISTEKEDMLILMPSAPEAWILV